jgi:hypothetical protein
VGLILDPKGDRSVIFLVRQPVVDNPGPAKPAEKKKAGDHMSSDQALAWRVPPERPQPVRRANATRQHGGSGA